MPTSQEFPVTKLSFTLKQLSSSLRTCTLGMGLSVAIAPLSHAQTVNETKKLKTVEITAEIESSDSPLEYLTEENVSGALGNKTVLETPFSVTVISSDEIVERGANSVGQIFVNDPGVYAPTPSSQTDWWGTQIRGLPVRNFYIDEVPMLLYWGGDFPTEASESVTALKGLTGFMYGFGEPGGALSYKTKRPTETPKTSVNLGYRDSSVFSAHLDTSHNLGEEFGFRTNLATEQGTAYNESEKNRTVTTLSTDKNFGESVNWFTSIVYEKNKLESEPLQFYFSRYDVAGSNGVLPKTSYDYGDFNIDNSYYETETVIASTGIEWQLGKNWDLIYKLGFSSKEHKSNKSFAYLLNREGDYEGYSYNFAGKLDNLFNQIMLQGIFSSGDITHELVAGVGSQQAEEKWGTDWYWENDFNGNIHEEQTFRMTRTPNYSLEPEASVENVQSYAFASDTIHFNDQWQTIIGFRFTDYDMKKSDYDTKNTSPTVAVIYKPNEQTSFYGSYVEGLEPGKVVDNTFANEGDLLDTTVSKQYEVGVKHTSGKFNSTLAIFKIERVNQMALGRNDGDDDDRLYLTQDGLEIYQGVEFSTAYQFTDNLNLGFGALYLDGTIEDISADNAELEGNAAAYASDWQLLANFTYKVANIEGLKLHGNIRYFGESYISTDNNLELPNYTIVNAGASYDFNMMSRAWKLNANINNLFNKKYWAGSGWSSGNMGEARNISLGLVTQF